MRFIEKTIVLILILTVFAQSVAGDNVPQVTAQFQLTNSTAYEYDAAWSPDDSAIVYIMDGLYGYELWTMDMATLNPKMLLQSTALLGQPDWGENGILYISDYSFKRDRHPNIWIYDLNEKKSWQLSFNKTDLQNPSWNNDSTKILYLRRVNYGYEIWTMNPDTYNNTLLTFFQTIVESPAWSPDNKKIAYSSDGDIWVMDEDASNIVQLTDDEYAQTDPTWSPDGNWIAYASDEQGDFDIYVMRPDGTDKSILINESRDQTDPDWSHGGNKLLYTSYQDLNKDIWAAVLYMEPAPTPTPVQLQTQIVVDEETKENISRLTIIGAVLAVLIMLFVLLKIIKGMKR
ncbi:MAG: DPP IV N-terminal domain-containing protein [ANME-2 cluster archaeon]|nr:DPP IV N-terminal domain-containing protein [ANME-2 cluster archaeon]